MKKFVPAIVLLLVSAIVLSTSSYAWFSLNKEVQATGMSANALAPANLLITDSNKATYEPASWKSSIEAYEKYSGKLYPSSTDDGENFYAVAAGQAIGDHNIGGVAKDGVTKFQEGIRSKLSPGTDDSATGYWAEFTFKMKTTGSNDLDVYLEEILFEEIDSDYVYKEVLGLNVGDSVESYFTYVPDSKAYIEAEGTAEAGKVYYEQISLYNAVRLAIFAKLEGGTSELIGIYAIDEDTDVDPVTSVTSVEAGAFVLNGGEDVIFSVGDAAKKFVVEADEKITEVLVRVWIEGQHEDCVNAAGGKGFTIGLKFNSIEQAG